MMYWAMRTSRDTPQKREFVTKELLERGRLRQGWGWDSSQDLRRIHKAWKENKQLSEEQKVASRHWRMADGSAGDYMSCGDIVLVPNMPTDGLFTLCRIMGRYQFERELYTSLNPLPRQSAGLTRWVILRST